MRRVRDFAQVKGDGRLTRQAADEALKMEAVDERGLDPLDRKFLQTIIDVYGGGPAGIEAIAATLNEEVDTLVDMVEPYLLKIGFVGRTRQGRVVTAPAYAHLGLKAPPRRSRAAASEGGVVAARRLREAPADHRSIAQSPVGPQYGQEYEQRVSPPGAQRCRKRARLRGEDDHRGTSQ